MQSTRSHNESVHDDKGAKEEGEDSQSGQSHATSTGVGSHCSKGSGANSDTDSIADALTKSKWIQRSKVLMLSLLTVAAAVIGTMTYVTTRNREVAYFESQYYNLASSVLDSTSQEAQRMFAAVHSFGNTLTTFTDSSDMQWPEITLPDFEVLGFNMNQISKAIQVTFSPLVTVENREQWEEYAVSNQGWLTQSLELQNQLSAKANQAQQRRHLEESDVPPIPEHIWSFVDGKPMTDEGDGLDFGPGNYGPVWQQSPAPSDPSIINYDLLSNPDFASVYKTMWETRLPILSSVLDLQFLYGSAVEYNSSDPTSFLMSPVYPFLPSRKHRLAKNLLSGFLVAVIPWDGYFVDILPTGVNGMVIVMNNTCGDLFSYQLNGPESIYLGQGDYHESRFSDLLVASQFNDFLMHNLSDPQICAYMMNSYPSSTLESRYISSKPVLYTSVVVLLFFFTAVVFQVYDYFVMRRQAKVAESFKRTQKIVSSMFPSTVRDRILEEGEGKDATELELTNNKTFTMSKHAKAQLKNFLDESINMTPPSEGPKRASDRAKTLDSKPIADFFPECTVCYADLVGFTAWSSVREPCQVFKLLETVYKAFDDLANRRRVFKVETVGDCYVAVTGIPDQRKDHAIAMCRFARDSLYKFNALTKKLEVTLGPDTADLSMRVGLHSGPITAGVLRGDNCRFQLFGETVNFVSRIESKGAPNRIHLSQETADLLIAAGKSSWIEVRSDPITGNDTEKLQTYWLKPHDTSAGRLSRFSSCSDLSIDLSVGDSSDCDNNNNRDSSDCASQVIHNRFDDRTHRLVEWTTDVMSQLLKQIVARRILRESYRIDSVQESSLDPIKKSENCSVLDEVVEIIHLPEFDVRGVKAKLDSEMLELPIDVIQQLRDYISILATMYRSNPFHNFEHASHVTMSVVKLLSRIVAPELNEHEMGDDHEIASSIHDYTYGITSDPLTQFACVFAALIHDVDHHGVPNMQLVKENSSLAARYNGKSVLEQNSVDVAWDLLMDVSFQDLRGAIYSSNEEKNRFRQLVVNSVMATDIMDKDLKALRNARWDRAFTEASPQDKTPKDAVDRKATIVIEHLIQASDIAHTMQHWHIYRKWNERLFHEMYNAYKDGRAEKDPAEFWYKGEIGFFDFYIIPLAKKLKDCGVFGVSSDEYLNYAEQNRKEWESKGREVVASMMEKYKSHCVDREVRLDDLEDKEPVIRCSSLLADKDQGAVIVMLTGTMSDLLEGDSEEDEEEEEEDEEKSVEVVKVVSSSIYNGHLEASFASSCASSES